MDRRRRASEGHTIEIDSVEGPQAAPEQYDEHTLERLSDPSLWLQVNDGLPLDGCVLVW